MTILLAQNVWITKEAAAAPCFATQVATAPARNDSISSAYINTTHNDKKNATSEKVDSRDNALSSSLRALAQDKAWQSIFTLESTLLYIYKHYIFFTYPLQTSANNV